MKSPSFHPRINRALSLRGVTPRHVTAFDSSTVLQEALAAFLRGEDYAAGPPTRFGRALGRAVMSSLPLRAKAWAYQMGARVDSVPPGSLGDFRSENVSQWITSRYPKRRYPVIFVGSSNGAVVHLAAALGVPWLPQNLLMLIRCQGLDPDSPHVSLEAGRQVAPSLLAAAPELELHQMQDPVQDRLMSREALYFRLKRLTLGAAYERFLLDCLEPGGTIVIVDCRLSWPCIGVGPRHVFQLGGEGALDAAEYYEEGEQQRQFLKNQAAEVRSWKIPAPDGERPEAEWGYAEQLTSDVLRFAGRHRYRVQRLSFEHPEHLSPWVADIYRERVVRDCQAADRLIVESFFLVDPWCVHRTGSVPFWTVFNGVDSAKSVAAYLDGSLPFEEIRAVLFSNGVRAPKTASIECWLDILHRARGLHGFLGVRPERYPEDFGVYLRYHEALMQLPDAPEPALSLEWADVREHAKASSWSANVQLDELIG